MIDLKDLVDGLTGKLLTPTLGLYQCRRCRTYYQEDSFEVIRRENGSKCVSCGHVEIANVSDQREQRGVNASVGAVTLEDYRKHVGRVVTFEGLVCNVITSRSGRSYAVMFEPTSWVKGFKMVIFGDEVSRVGGAPFLLGLRGRRLRVRGLVTRHDTFGYQIIVSDRAMILGIQ
jgi:hypothetical protein